MLWFKNAKTRQLKSDGDVIVPTQLSVAFDPEILNHKLGAMLEAMNTRGGIEPYLEALENKSVQIREALTDEMIDQLDEVAFDALLDTVFTARRKLPAGLAHVPIEVIKQQLKTLVRGDGPMLARIQLFVESVTTDDRKVRGAAWDFAAELLHFNSPEQYPLLCRWVWDQKAQSGALREFIRGNDSMQKIPVRSTPEDLEAYRVWMRERLSEQGFYQRLPYLIDCVMAQAYAEYVLAMSSGMGMMGSEFGAKMEPIDFLTKLLGIDPARRNGKLRVKKASVH